MTTDPEAPNESNAGEDDLTESQTSLEGRIAEDLDPDLKRVISAMPRAEQGKIISMISAKSHRGLLPDPETLEEYNRIIPNGAERIMAMAEKEGDHRRAMHKTIINRQLNQKGLGQAFGFLLGLTSLLIGGYLVHEGHESAGTIYGGVGVTSLVAVFVIGRYFKSKED